MSQDEIEAHEAAMQRVVDNEKMEQEAINNKKDTAIKDADDKKNQAVKVADEKMRKKIEAAQRENDKVIKAAKKEEEDEIKAAEMISGQKRMEANQAKESKAGRHAEGL